MNGMIGAFQSFMEFVQNGFVWIQHIFKGIAMALTYVTKTVQMEWAIIGTLPSWLQGFCIISMCMAIALIIAGRYGK